MKLMVYGMVPVDRDVGDDFFVVNEYIVNDVFRRFRHEVFTVSVGGCVFEDFQLEVDYDRNALTLVELIRNITTRGFYSVDGKVTAERWMA